MGSLLQLHATAAPIRSADDLAGADERLKALVFFGLLARGVYLARRGFMALSLPWGDGECERLDRALAEVLAIYADLWR